MTSIPPIDLPDMPEELQAALRPRVERLGYLGDFFRLTAHQPVALRAFVELTESARGALPSRLAELVALTVATAAGNRYEQHQHERLSIRLGLGREWVAAVEQLRPEELTDAGERAVQRYVVAALGDLGRNTHDLLEDVVERVGVAEAVAVLFVVGRYVAHAVVVNSLAISPPVPSIFEDGFDG